MVWVFHKVLFSVFSMSSKLPNLNNRTAVPKQSTRRGCFNRRMLLTVVRPVRTLERVVFFWWAHRCRVHPDRHNYAVCICGGMNVHARMNLQCPSVWTMQSSKVTDGEGKDGGAGIKLLWRHGVHVPPCFCQRGCSKIWRKGVTPGGHFAVIFCSRAESIASETSPNSRKFWEAL